MHRNKIVFDVEVRFTTSYVFVQQILNVDKFTSRLPVHLLLDIVFYRVVDNLCGTCREGLVEVLVTCFSLQLIGLVYYAILHLLLCSQYLFDYVERTCSFT